MGARERILEAAAAEFAEKGYAGTTTRAIAARAEVNEVTLFRHFRTKQELLEQVLTSGASVAAIGEEMFGGLEALPLRAALHHMASTWAKHMEPRMAWLRIRIWEQSDQPTLRKPEHTRYRERIAQFIRARQAAGEVRPDVDPMLAAEALGTGVVGFLVAHRAMFPEEAAPDLDTYLKQFADLLWRGMAL